MRGVVLMLLLDCAISCAAAWAADKKPKAQNESIEQYLAKLKLAPPGQTLPIPAGSLFVSTGLLAEPFADFRAHAVGDSLSVQIVESTTISQSGSLTSQRDFSHTSGVTGIMGQAPSVLNPLLAANSSTKLAGTGASASQSSLNTTLTGLVVAVLPNGLLVVEAHRHVAANQQHENVTLRGIVRPADIAPNNSVFSYQLFNLELEVQGKGVISDTVRRPNAVVRTLLKLLSF
jgi:flagellar L-ring protein precursor FlgH